MTIIKGGVAGAGVFGGYHAKKYASLPGAALAAVYDLDIAKARAMAEPLGGQGYDDYAAFLAAVNAVTVTSPAVAHAGLAAPALRAGRDLEVDRRRPPGHGPELALGVVVAVGAGDRAPGGVDPAHHQIRHHLRRGSAVTVIAVGAIAGAIEVVGDAATVLEA